MQNYIISDNHNNILFILDNIKLCFNIIKNLYSSQLDLLHHNKLNNNNNIFPIYYLTYSKDHTINIYLFKILNNNVLIYFNNEFSTDENSIDFISFFKKKYNFNKEDLVQMQKELTKQLEKLKIMNTSYNNDLEIFNKINKDILDNKITEDDINPVFRNKYDFFNTSNTKDNNIITEYEKKFFINYNN